MPHVFGKEERGCSVCCADGTVDANTDFYCKLTCTSGTEASPNATFVAAPGIYDPPYKINNNNTQLDLSTKVRSLPILSHECSYACKRCNVMMMMMMQVKECFDLCRQFH